MKGKNGFFPVGCVSLLLYTGRQRYFLSKAYSIGSENVCAVLGCNDGRSRAVKGRALSFSPDEKSKIAHWWRGGAWGSRRYLTSLYSGAGGGVVGCMHYAWQREYHLLIRQSIGLPGVFQRCMICSRLNLCTTYTCGFQNRWNTVLQSVCCRNIYCFVVENAWKGHGRFINLQGSSVGM